MDAIYQALVDHPTAAMLAIRVVALGWLFRDSRVREQQAAKALADAGAAHLQTAMQVAPLAGKLVTCVEVLERLSARQGA